MGPTRGFKDSDSLGLDGFSSSVLMSPEHRTHSPFLTGIVFFIEFSLIFFVTKIIHAYNKLEHQVKNESHLHTTVPR